MSGFNVDQIIGRLEKMETEMNNLEQAMREYHGKMNHFINELESEGLPEEYIRKLKDDHVEKLSNYFNGLSRHIEEESIPYTRKVIEQTRSLRETIG